MNLKEIGEFNLISRIAEKVRQQHSVKIGIGDDAAATEPLPGHVTLTSADMLVEGVHFDLSLCDPRTLGRKSLAVNLSDIAAMGGIPRHFLLGLAVPPQLELSFIEEYIEGLMEMADRFGVSLIGGDTCASRVGLVIAITIMGEQLPTKIVERRGARPGDLVFVTGTLGDSALGLALLRKGHRKGFLVTRHLDPKPRVCEGVALAESGLITAMIDVSDGLLADLGHILDLSGVGARLGLHHLPLSPAFAEEAGASGINDRFLYPLSGGEDYELLFTAHPSREDEIFALMTKLSCPVARIGEITAGGGLSVFKDDGTPYRITHRGYDHFGAG